MSDAKPNATSAAPAGPAAALPADTRLGRIFLRVRELESAVAFYQGVLGLELVERQGGGALLGSGGRALVGLIEAPEAMPAPRAPGLYHMAFLLPDRAALGRFLEHTVRVRARLQGASDHGVSEAVYLADSEGNGIEVYRDYPRAQWPQSDAGVTMITAPLDARAVLAAAGPSEEPYRAPAGTVLGHVHLQVSDLERARHRYAGVVGFEVTQSDYPGALFVAAGGYHHHLGLNTWGTAGRAPRPPGSLGLAWFELVVPDAAERQALEARLAAASEARHGESEAFPATLYYDADGIAVAVTGG